LILIADKTVSSSAIPKGQPGSKFDFKKQIGSSPPFAYFDPAGFTNDVTEEQYKLYQGIHYTLSVSSLMCALIIQLINQESEIKHGRVAMIAFLGLVFGELAAPNGIFGKIDGPAIYQFQQTYTVVPIFWQATLAICGLIESVNIMRGWQPLEDSLREPSGLAKLKPSYIPGTLGFDPLGFAPKSPQGLDSMKVKELNNGRLAMIAVAGIVAQELVSGKSIF